MSEYANVGGKRVLICDIEEWLLNRDLIAVPRVPTEDMEEAADEPFHAAIKDARERSERMGQPMGYASISFSIPMWRAMVNAAPSLSLNSIQDRADE